MAIWKKAMDYLGLGPDDAYDDYDPSQEQERPKRNRDDASRNTGEHEATVRTMPARPTYPIPSGGDATARRPSPPPDDSSVQPRPINPRQGSTPRTAPGPMTGDPYTVRPRRFDSAQEIADKFKEGLPVIMNLEAADREVSRRLIDFASGLCYGLNGSMEKVATGVYLLKPVPARSTYES
jgi:cell division inhibitor SepF